MPICILLDDLSISVVKADWTDYEKELDNLKFQDTAEFHKHMDHAISMVRKC